ncbi:hypothetical protein STXM2123_5001 [Streptomyces sp. F-3]|nr:hypothetical protein STXM2123_5001 [Streptomyces sp. F-3]
MQKRRIRPLRHRAPTPTTTPVDAPTATPREPSVTTLTPRAQPPAAPRTTVHPDGSVREIPHVP